MKSVLLAAMLTVAGIPSCYAQGKPMEDCAFPADGFALFPGQTVQIAEVARRSAVQLWMCGDPKGCVEAPVSLGAAVRVYRQQGSWTCGYVSDRKGAGPAWIRSDALRMAPHDPHPPLKAWAGTWTGGGDRVRIGMAGVAGELRLAGHAVWMGQYSTHSGGFHGSASPDGNHLRFREGGDGSCTVDMTLVGRYILASDNEACGGMNVRFEGIWKRIAP